ncbi:MAG: flagellar biosynthesis protein FlhB [Rhizobacter sp.]
MAEQEQSRTEQATPYKLREARRRGQVAKSLELSSLLALLTLLAVMLLWARSLVERQFRFDALLLEQAYRLSFDPAALPAWLARITTDSLSLLMPLVLPLVAIAIVGGFLQAGPVFSFHPLKPDIDRINPVSGFKRLFSLRLLFETGKNLLKLVLYGMAVWLLARSLLGPLLALLDVPPLRLLDVTLSQATAIVFKLLLVVALIAIADMLYTRWSWQDKLKMSRREVREELKSHEGDPRIRSRRRELRREMLKRAQAVKRLPDADVLITNPTHLAVALSYRREEMAAPVIIAKGSGEMAAHMKVLARRHAVPVVESPTLARALFAAAGIDDSVPERLYPAVARLLVWVYALRERGRGASGAVHSGATGAHGAEAAAQKTQGAARGAQAAGHRAKAAGHGAEAAA